MESFAVLEPTADGFLQVRWRRAHASGRGPADRTGRDADAERARADGALVGGLRALGANAQPSDLGVFTELAGALTTDFFVTRSTWAPAEAASDAADVFEGRARGTGAVTWTGSRVDLLFGSNSELRALAEVYACDDAREKFVSDFVAAWDKVMELGSVRSRVVRLPRGNGRVTRPGPDRHPWRRPPIEGLLPSRATRPHRHAPASTSRPTRPHTAVHSATAPELGWRHRTSAAATPRQRGREVARARR